MAIESEKFQLMLPCNLISMHNEINANVAIDYAYFFRDYENVGKICRE